MTCIQKEVENLNRPISSKDYDLIIKYIPNKDIPGSIDGMTSTI